MTSATRAAARYLAPLPPERLALLRLLVGGYALGYLVVRLPHLLAVAGFGRDPRFDPVGPLWFLASPVPPAVGHAILTAAVLAGAAFVLGWRWRVTGPGFAVLFLAVTTYRSSWGQVFHTDNLVALHLLLIAIAPAADAWSLDRRRRPTTPAAVQPTSAHGWPVRLCSLVTVLAYAVSGWAKLRNGGIDWVTGDTLRNQIAHDNLRKALMGDVWSPLGGHAVRYGWLFPPLAAISVAVELGAPLALVFRRLRTSWAVAAWLFHLGVLALMAIAFPYQLTGIAFASLFATRRRRAAADDAPSRSRMGAPCVAVGPGVERTHD